MQQNKSIGQKEQVWTDWWKGITPESEIRMWDFYGGRQWISKYVPRYGKVVEAGCGLGRYNFYFSKFGIDIEGVDFSKETIELLNNWQTINNLRCNFKVGDVCNLDYPDNSLSGYISLGVVEHFIEGPQKPINEAYRVLRPGGVAIITTPNRSWLIRWGDLLRIMKITIKKILRRKIIHPAFFQYEYDLITLKNLVQKSGLIVTAAGNCDLLYTLYEHGGYSGKNIRYDSLYYRLSQYFENSIINSFGAQSITISVKKAQVMFCFLCDNHNVGPESLDNFSVPICYECANSQLAKFYRKGIIPRFAQEYILRPELMSPTNKSCDICNKFFISDQLFENFGFNINVCPACLSDPDVNIELCNSNLQPIWRNRVSKD